MFEKLKQINKNVKLTSISTSFFGVNLEFGVDSISKADICDIMRELYRIRKTLAKFYFTYQAKYDYHLEQANFSLDNLENDINETYNEIDKIVIHEVFIAAFNLYELIESELLDSKYFVLLPFDNRKQLMQIFDCAREHEIMMNIDNDYSINIDDNEGLISGLLNLFIKIEDEIEKFNELLHKAV